MVQIASYSLAAIVECKARLGSVTNVTIFANSTLESGICNSNVGVLFHARKLITPL